MLTSLIQRLRWIAWGLVTLVGSAAPVFTGVERQTNGGVVLRWTGTPGTTHQLQASSNLVDWTTLTTTRAAAVNQETDAGAAYLNGRAYRVLDLGETNLLTGDHLTTDAGDVVLRPVNHASLVLQWRDRMIYNDPVGSASLYANLPKADLILVSHSHGDHFNAATLSAVLAPDGFIVAPAAVYTSLSATPRTRTIPLANGQSTNLLNLTVEAVPAYNANHPKGVGNGHVLTIGGRRVYFSGDTGDIPEMRALPDIDVAYVCMNVPFTMTVAQASSAVRAFRPGVVYPYHFRNQDNTRANTNLFKSQIGTDLGIEVRLRTWY